MPKDERSELVARLRKLAAEIEDGNEVVFADEIASNLLLAAAALTPSEQGSVVIPMLLYCPQCGLQHIDAPDERTPDWTNPPHRSHLCHNCGCIWRPADVPTEGVVAIETVGKADTWTTKCGNAEQAQGSVVRLREALERLRNHPKIAGCRPLHNSGLRRIFDECDDALSIGGLNNSG